MTRLSNGTNADARDKPRATLHLVCGLPGAGKTTLAKKLEAQSGAVRLCPDEWMTALHVSILDAAFRERLEQQLTELARGILRQGGDVVIEFGSWSKAERETLRNVAQQSDAAVHLYWLEVPVTELARRVRARGDLDAALLDERYLQDTSDRIERPDEQEASRFDRFEQIEFAGVEFIGVESEQLENT